MDRYRDVLAACRQGIVPKRFRVQTRRRPPSAELLEQYVVAGCSEAMASLLPPPDDEVAVHAYSLWLLRADRRHALELFGDYWRHDTLARRLMHFEALDDDDDDGWQREARSLFLATDGGAESRWTLFLYLECARRLEVVSDRAGDATTVLEAFVARFEDSRVPLTRLAVSHALYSLAALYTDRRRALAALERAALHNDVVASPLQRVAVEALAGERQECRARAVADHVQQLIK